MNNESVLIVDDNRMMRDALRDMLEAKGYHVHTCEDASSALTVACEKQFDIVLSDYQLPLMNGDEMVCLLRQLRPDAFIIGFSLANKQEAFRAAGADLFISKEHLYAEILPTVESRAERRLRDM